MQVHYRASN